jgi:putative ABC transport system permease protein
MDSDWGNYYYDTYLQLQPGVSAQAVADKLTQIHIKNQAGTSGINYLAQPLSQLHLYNADGTSSGIQTVRVFLIVAILILLIACINYINLSTGQCCVQRK